MTRRCFQAGVALAAPLMLAARPCRAQQFTADESRHGTLVIGSDDHGVRDPAARRGATSLAEQLLDVLRRDAAIASPVGYTVTLRRVDGSRGNELGGDPAMPYYAGVSGNYWGYLLKDGKPEPDASGRTPIAVYANTLWACPYDEDFSIEDRGKPMLDGGPPILAGLRRTGEMRGHPIYRGECVVITNRPEPPYLPVTRERYMRLEILGMRARVDRQRRQIDYDKLDPKWRAAYDDAFKQSDRIIAAREEELARMSPSDRALPAAVRVNGPSDSTLVGLDDPDGVPLVTTNPAFFDRSAPPSKAQVIIVDLPFLQKGAKPISTPDEPERRAHGERIRDQLDWAALEAMVKP